MTPANTIQAAIAMLERAVNECHASGVAIGALAQMDDAVAALKEAHDELPGLIFDYEGAPCASCQHRMRESMLVPYGDRTITQEYSECTAARPLDCPIVNACGWVDETKPENWPVPAFLRRQAD